MNALQINLENRYLIFHVGSSEVLGSIVSFNTNLQKVVIEFQTQADILSQDKSEKGLDYEGLRKAMNKVSSSLFDYIKILGVYDIDQSFVFLTAPWSQKNMSTLVDERPIPFKITEKYLEELIGQAGEVKETEVLLKPEITMIKANGYSVELGQLLNQTISKIELSMVDTTVDKRVEKIIDGTIKTRFNTVDVTMLGFLSAYLNQIKTTYNTINDFAFLNFSKGMNELGVVKNNKVETVFQVPVGVHSVATAFVSKNIAKNYNEAIYILDLYLNNKVDESLTKKIENIIKKEKVIFTNFLTKHNIFIPKVAFVIGVDINSISLFKKFSFFETIIAIDHASQRDFVLSENGNFNNLLSFEARYIFGN